MKDHCTILLKTAGILIVTMLVLAPLTTFAAEGNRIEDHIVETETGIYYIVQPGDTLWDLSQQFSDSPWLWPDLWKENQDIPNPHLIYPGQRIRIYLRKDIGDIPPGAEPGPAPGDRGTYTYKAMDAVGFIRYPALAPSGIIFHVQEPKAMIDTDDIVYIKPEIPADFRAGEFFTIYRTLKPLRNETTEEVTGVQHLLNGVVEITDIQPDVVVAKVVETFRPIEVDDQVTPYLNRPNTIPLRKSVPGLEGKLMFSEEPRAMIAEYHIAFIDKGRKDGIEVGQIYAAFSQEEKIVDRKTIRLPRVKIGELLVLHIEDTTSTVVITQSDKPMPPETDICTPF